MTLNGGWTLGTPAPSTAARKATYASNSEAVHFHDLEVIGFQGEGLYADAGNAGLDGIKIVNNHVHDTHLNGININATGDTLAGSVVHGNMINAVVWSAIQVVCKTCIISENTIWGMNSGGNDLILVAGCRSFAISRNIVRDCVLTNASPIIVMNTIWNAAPSGTIDGNIVTNVQADWTSYGAPIFFYYGFVDGSGNPLPVGHVTVVNNLIDSSGQAAGLAPAIAIQGVNGKPLGGRIVIAGNSFQKGTFGNIVTGIKTYGSYTSSSLEIGVNFFGDGMVRPYDLSVTPAKAPFRSSKPTLGLSAGYTYFDTSLGIPIWFDGFAWRDSAGAVV